SWRRHTWKTASSGSGLLASRIASMTVLLPAPFGPTSTTRGVRSARRPSLIPRRCLISTDSITANPLGKLGEARAKWKCTPCGMRLVEGHGRWTGLTGRPGHLREPQARLADGPRCLDEKRTLPVG